MPFQDHSIIRINPQKNRRLPRHRLFIQQHSKKLNQAISRLFLFQSVILKFQRIG